MYKIDLPRRKSPRMKTHDYSRGNIYFITSCVKGWRHSFGEVENGKMVLSEYGRVAQAQWNWLFNQYPYIKSHGFIVMPNHVHGLLEIIPVIPESSLPMKILPLYRIIGAYKTTTSKKIHLSGNENFEWQRSFHDSIVRNAKSIERVKKYMERNPERWEEKRGDK